MDLCFFRDYARKKWPPLGSKHAEKNPNMAATIIQWVGCPPPLLDFGPATVLFFFLFFAIDPNSLH
jgi:hypothetical protein